MKMFTDVLSRDRWAQGDYDTIEANTGVKPWGVCRVCGCRSIYAVTSDMGENDIFITSNHIRTSFVMFREEPLCTGHFLQRKKRPLVERVARAAREYFFPCQGGFDVEDFYDYKVVDNRPLHPVDHNECAARRSEGIDIPESYSMYVPPTVEDLGELADENFRGDTPDSLRIPRDVIDTNILRPYDVIDTHNLRPDLRPNLIDSRELPIYRHPSMITHDGSYDEIDSADTEFVMQSASYNKATVGETNEVTLNFKGNNMKDHSSLFSQKPFDGSMKQILEQPSRLDVKPWADTLAQGTAIVRYIVSPHERALYPPHLGSSSHDTNLSYFSRCYGLWKGSLKYHIEILSSPYHQGQLFIAFEPGNMTGHATTFDACLNLPSTTIDLGVENRETIIEIPWISNTEYKFVTEGNGHETFVATGTLHVFVQNPLKVMSEMLANTVDINVYISAGSDFELKGFHQPLVKTVHSGTINDDYRDFVFQSEGAVNIDNPQDARSERSLQPDTELTETTDNTIAPSVLAPTANMDVSNLMNRAFLVDKGTFTSISKNVISEVKIPTVFATRANLMPYQMLSVHNFFKSDFECEIRVDTTKFHTGSLIVFYVPTTFGQWDDNSQASLMNFPHCRLNLTQQTSAKFIIPFASTRLLWMRTPINAQLYPDEHVSGKLYVFSWNSLGMGVKAPTEMDYTLWLKPLAPHVGSQIPVIDTSIEWQSAQPIDTTGCSSESVITTDQMNIYDLLKRPCYVNTLPIIEANDTKRTPYQGPSNSGFTYHYLTAPFGYASGGHNLQFVSNADKTYRQKFIIDICNPGDPGFEHKRVLNGEFIRPTTVTAIPQRNPTYWFPQEQNSLEINAPHYTQLPVYSARTPFNSNDNMGQSMECYYPSTVSIFPSEITNMDTTTAGFKDSRIDVWHTVASDFKLYFLGGLPLTGPDYDMPTIPVPPADEPMDTISVDLDALDLSDDVVMQCLEHGIVPKVPKPRSDSSESASSGSSDEETQDVDDEDETFVIPRNYKFRGFDRIARCSRDPKTHSVKYLPLTDDVEMQSSNWLMNVLQISWAFLQSMGITLSEIVTNGANWILEKIRNFLNGFLQSYMHTRLEAFKSYVWGNLGKFVAGFFMFSAAMWAIVNLPYLAIGLIRTVFNWFGTSGNLAQIVTDSFDPSEPTDEFEFQGADAKYNIANVVVMLMTTLLGGLFGIKFCAGDVLKAGLHRVSGSSLQELITNGIQTGFKHFFGDDDAEEFASFQAALDRVNGEKVILTTLHLDRLGLFSCMQIDHLLEEKDQLPAGVRLNGTPREFVVQMAAVNQVLADHTLIMATHSNSRLFTRFLSVFGPIYQGVTKMSAVSAGRSEPVGVWVAGPSGVGKSYLTSNVMPKTILSGLDITTFADAKNQIYSLPMNTQQKFFDGYANQAYTYLDDIGSLRDGTDLTDMLQMISTGVCSVNMAKVEDKGTVFTSSFVVGSSNYKQMVALPLKGVEPLIRRFKFAYEMELTAAYSTADGKLDMTKLITELTTTQSMDVYDQVWKFHSLDLATGTSAFTYDTYSQMTKKIMDEYKTRRTVRTDLDDLLDKINSPAINMQGIFTKLIGYFGGTPRDVQLDAYFGNIAQKIQVINAFQHTTDMHNPLISQSDIDGFVKIANPRPDSVTHNDFVKYFGYGDPKRWFSDASTNMSEIPSHVVLHALAVVHLGTQNLGPMVLYPLKDCIIKILPTPSGHALYENTFCNPGWKGLLLEIGKTIKSDWCDYLIGLLTVTAFCLLCKKVLTNICGFAYVDRPEKIVAKIPQGVVFQDGGCQTDRVRRNTVRILDPNQLPIASGVMYDSHHIIVNTHVLKYLLNKGFGSFWIKAPLMKCNMHVPFKNAFVQGEYQGTSIDTSVVLLPCAMQNVRKLEGSIPTQQMFEEKMNGRAYEAFHIRHGSVRTVLIEGNRSYKDTVYVFGTQSASTTDKGDCGTPYVMDYAACAKPFFGIHSGQTAKKPYGWIIAPVTKEIISTCIARLGGERIHVDGYEFQVKEVSEMFKHYDECKTIIDIGEVSMGGVKISSPVIEGTSKVESRIHDQDLWKDDFQPAPQSKQILLDRFRATYDVEDAKNVPRVVYDWCLREINDSFDSVEYTRERRVLTTDETLNVTPTFPNLGPFDRTSSAGWWSKVSDKKTGIIGRDPLVEGELNHYFLEETAPHPYVGKTFGEYIEEAEADCREGKQFLTLWTATLKDELRTSEKCRIKKTRQFQSGGFDHGFLCKKFFGAFGDFYRGNPGFELMHGIGNDKEAVWQEYYHGLRDLNTQGWDIDGVNYGAGIRGQPSQFFEDVVSHWYAQTDHSEESDRTARATIISMVRHSWHIVSNHICQVNQGNKDGFWLTDVYNSITNCGYNMFTFCMLYRAKFGTLPTRGKFRQCVRMLTYGDDVILTATPDVTRWFNRVTSAEVMLHLGLKVTSAKKTGEMIPFEDISALTFLKSYFTPDNGIVRAPMPKEVIYKQLNWHKKTVNHEPHVRRDIVLGALRDAFHLGREFYEQTVSEVQTKLAECDEMVGETIEYLSYEEQFSRVAALQMARPTGDKDFDTQGGLAFDEMASLQEVVVGYFGAVGVFAMGLPQAAFHKLLSNCMISLWLRNYVSFINFFRAVSSDAWLTTPLLEEYFANSAGSKITFGIIEFVIYLIRGKSWKSRVSPLCLHLLNASILKVCGNTWKCYILRVILHGCFNYSVMAKRFEKGDYDDLKQRLLDLKLQFASRLVAEQKTEL